MFQMVLISSKRAGRRGLRRLKQLSQGSIGTRLDKIKDEFDTEVTNATRMPKIVLKREAAELLFRFIRADLTPSKLIPFAGTLKWIASLSPTTAKRSSYFGYAKSGVQAVINVLSPTRRRQLLGRQAPHARLASPSDPFASCSTKNAAYSDLADYLLAYNRVQEELKRRQALTPPLRTVRPTPTPLNPVMKGEDDFAESPPWLSLDPAPVPTNQLCDLPDSMPILGSQPEMPTSAPVRLLSSPEQEEPFSSMSFSADSHDLCFSTLDRRQEALDSALFIQPRQQASGSDDDVSAVTDEIFSPSPLSELELRQEMRVLPMRSFQPESFSIRPSLPSLGFAMTNQVQQYTSRRPQSQTEVLDEATWQPVDMELLPESQADLVHGPSGPVDSKTAVEIHAEPKMRNFDMEIAAAKLRMVEIFSRAKKTFVRVESKPELTGINAVTPIGAVTSSIKYLVMNTTNVAMARHNWVCIALIPKFNEGICNWRLRISQFLLHACVCCRPARQLGRLSREKLNLETWFAV
ncbi:hypothetical protein V1506DRAFT_577023 [Lipomyces tetrasporus]